PEYHTKGLACPSVWQPESLLRHFHHGASNRKRSRCGGGRDVKHVQHVAAMHDVEVVHQRAIPIESLGANARAARHQTRRRDLGNEPLQSGQESMLAPRAVELAHAVAPMHRRETPEAWVRERL